MQTYFLKVEPKNSQLRLDIFLAQNLEFIPSRNAVRKYIDCGYVTVNGSQVKAHHKISVGDDVKLEIPKLNFKKIAEHITPENIPLDIFYEDEEILVVNKPEGMLVHPVKGCYSGTLVNALLFHCQNLSDINTISKDGNVYSKRKEGISSSNGFADSCDFTGGFRPGIVHRLDKETSGLLVIAKTNQAHVRLARQFEKRQVAKRYVALVEGIIEFDEGIIDVPLGRHRYYYDKKMVSFDGDAKSAETIYRVLTRFNKTTLVALYPKTGRTHQLRVHMTYLGHPILGDNKYKGKQFFSRLALHAQSLGFLHPRTKKNVEFSVVLPKEFNHFVDD